MTVMVSLACVRIRNKAGEFVGCGRGWTQEAALVPVCEQCGALARVTGRWAETPLTSVERTMVDWDRVIETQTQELNGLQYVLVSDQQRRQYFGLLDNPPGGLAVAFHKVEYSKHLRLQHNGVELLTAEIIQVLERGLNV